MSHVYRSSVKATTHKDPLESPQTPYAEPQPAADADMPPDTAAATLPDTEADTPPPTETDAETPSPADNAADTRHASDDVDTVSSPPSGMDPFATMIPLQHQSYQISCVHLFLDQP